MNHRFKNIITLLCIICSIGAAGQSTNFVHFDTEDGLPQSQVQTIQQDDDGNLWIGTMAGLAKYNGQTFTNFSKQDSLAEDWITTSYKDKSGNIWLGHWGGGVSKYIQKSKAFINLDFDIISQFNPITAILEDSDGNFWFGTDGGGVYRYDILNNTVYVVTSDEELSGDYVSSICEDNIGNIWIGTDNGITIYDKAQAINAEEAYTYLNIEKGLIVDNITVVQSVLDNEIWVGTGGAGIVIIKILEGVSINELETIHDAVSTIITTEDGLSSNGINSIFEDDDNTIWIGTSTGGVTKFIPDEGPRDNDDALRAGTYKTLSTRQGLNYHKVNVVFQDREGNYWIGTEVGLNRYRSDKFQIYDDADGLANNIIWSVIEDSHGNLWMGTNNGISQMLLNEAGSYSIENYYTTDGLVQEVILAVCEDDEGNIWFGSASNGVSRLSKDGRFKSFNTDNGLADNTVYSITKAINGDVWFGTKKGASRYNPDSESFESFTSKDGLGGNNIYRVYADSKGKIWFGVLGGALSVYDGTSFTNFRDEEGIGGNFVLSIAEDGLGNIWLGIYGSGLLKYDGTDFKRYTQADGLSSESPSLIIADNENNIWVGSSKGLDKLNQETGTISTFGKKEGFLGIETNANSVCKDSKGNLWFGTIMGLVKYDPSQDIPNEIPPSVSLESMRIKLKEAELLRSAVYNYDQNHFTFEYLGISLTNPGEVVYSYKLDGFDEEWTPVSRTNSATYSNLPHGEFDFQIKAANAEGVWSEPSSTYNFIVTPPFWKTIWFYAICIVVAVLGIFAFDRIRTASLKKEKKVLEDKVQERTAELAIKNEELAEINEDITASIRYAKRIQEAILPPISIITKHYPESFVYYEPKDIVSGDFYWMDQIGDKLMVAAVDCTGHGVPGAFMSIIGNNLLSDYVNKQKMTTPSKILDSLSKGVYDTLRQSEEEQDAVKDAMDLAFCSIDTKTNKLQFAAAYNPLYLVRNGEILETKADRKAIGEPAEEATLASYTNHEMDLQKGDTIYIFSDGYVDQFGGKKGKKFMGRRFRQMILDINSMSMKEQEEFMADRLTKWKGERDQVDDVLVIGIKI
ncbi:MAG: hypothetical protein COB85_07640 [Bacteroidetes bacterium]|nr:MAG: hypothetical protein COB85_07640 [Bacteroidota bacterium]